MNELTHIFNQLVPANREKVLTLARTLLAEQEATPAAYPVPCPRIDRDGGNEPRVILVKTTTGPREPIIIPVKVEQPPREPIRVLVELLDAPQVGETS